MVWPMFIDPSQTNDSRSSVFPAGTVRSTQLSPIPDGSSTMTCCWNRLGAGGLLTTLTLGVLVTLTLGVLATLTVGVFATVTLGLLTTLTSFDACASAAPAGANKVRPVHRVSGRARIEFPP